MRRKHPRSDQLGGVCYYSKQSFTIAAKLTGIQISVSTLRGILMDVRNRSVGKARHSRSKLGQEENRGGGEGVYDVAL